MKRWLGALALLGLAHAAGAASVPSLTGPQDPSQLNATVNGVIANVNAILSPLTGGNAAGTVNQFVLNPAVTGGLAAIGLQSGADANAGIGITPNGSGNIVLFAGGYLNTGVLQFGNPASFVRVNGLSVCPGAAPNRPPLGVSAAVTGYFAVQDWLGRPRAIPVC